MLRSPEVPPKVEVGYRKQNKFYTFWIKDNGIGISKEFQDKIFVIFQRLHRQDEYEGTGIGLAICQKIVQRHGGEIGVESEKDKGADFYFSLPK